MFPLKIYDLVFVTFFRYIINWLFYFSHFALTLPNILLMLEERKPYHSKVAFFGFQNRMKVQDLCKLSRFLKDLIIKPTVIALPHRFLQLIVSGKTSI